MQIRIYGSEALSMSMKSFFHDMHDVRLKTNFYLFIEEANRLHFQHTIDHVHCNTQQSVWIHESMKIGMRTEQNWFGQRKKSHNKSRIENKLHV